MICGASLEVQIKHTMHSIRCHEDAGHLGPHVGPAGSSWTHYPPRVRMPEVPDKCSCGNSFEDPNNMCMISACQMET